MGFLAEVTPRADHAHIAFAGRRVAPALVRAVMSPSAAASAAATHCIVAAASVYTFGALFGLALDDPVLSASGYLMSRSRAEHTHLVGIMVATGSAYNGQAFAPVADFSDIQAVEPVDNFAFDSFLCEPVG